MPRNQPLSRALVESAVHQSINTVLDCQRGSCSFRPSDRLADLGVPSSSRLIELIGRRLPRQIRLDNVDDHAMTVGQLINDICEKLGLASAVA